MSACTFDILASFVKSWGRGVAAAIFVLGSVRAEHGETGVRQKTQERRNDSDCETAAMLMF